MNYLRSRGCLLGLVALGLACGDDGDSISESEGKSEGALTETSGLDDTVGEDTGGPVVDTESWIESGPSGPPDDHPQLGDDDDDDDDDDGEPEAYWTVLAQYDRGKLSDAEGEFFVEGGGQDLCLLFFGVEIVGPAEGCETCEYAWELRFGEVEVELDREGACADHLDRAIEGVTHYLGQGQGETLWQRDDEGWYAYGEYFFEDEGEIVMEWLVYSK